MTIDFRQDNTCAIHSSTEYTPIDCGDYDYLELWALKKTNLHITYAINNEEHKTQGRITNLFTKNKKEFMEINNSSIIRLDMLLLISTI